MLSIKVYKGAELLETYNDYIISVWKLCIIAKQHGYAVEDLHVEALRF